MHEGEHNEELQIDVTHSLDELIEFASLIPEFEDVHNEDILDIDSTLN